MFTFSPVSNTNSISNSTTSSRLIFRADNVPSIILFVSDIDDPGIFLIKSSICLEASSCSAFSF